MLISPASFSNKGFTLVELLIALVVLSIGFTGYAALQIVGIRSVEDSYQRSQMTVLVEELAERMRSNRQGLGSYVGLIYQQGVDDCAELGADVIEANNCERSDWAVGDDTCVAAEMAQYDVAKVFCGQKSGNTWFGGVNNVSDQASIGIIADPAVAGGFLLTGSWTLNETDRDDSADQDDDGSTQTMTQFVIIAVTP